MNTLNKEILDAEIIYPSEDENTTLERLDKKYEKISFMSTEERAFLNTLVLRNKPAKLL
jgi:hypothetical protein